MQYKMKLRELGAAWLNEANCLAPHFPNVYVTSRAVHDDLSDGDEAQIQDGR